MNWPIFLDWMKNNLLFTRSTNILVRLVIVRVNGRKNSYITIASLNEPIEALKMREKRESPKQSLFNSTNSGRCPTHNIVLSFESGAKQRPVTLIFKVVERGLYSSFLQAPLITDIIPKSAKNMLLTLPYSQHLFIIWVWGKTTPCYFNL